MKTTIARQTYKCALCQTTIERGQKYVKKTTSFSVQSTTWGIDDRPKDEIPEWAWSTERISVAKKHCVPCYEATQ